MKFSCHDENGKKPMTLVYLVYCDLTYLDIFNHMPIKGGGGNCGRILKLKVR